ncbi:hypothetical protein VKT23_010734 [Stygiomarasmius scandens]|uniref:Lysine-specific metallo-endopeptidase domain-containing protein n=1 Tax=Marasmiellus scandens TaxID=2682957 RepID=A0ABR1JFV5_9AGAR
MFPSPFTSLYILVALATTPSCTVAAPSEISVETSLKLKRATFDEDSCSERQQTVLKGVIKAADKQADESFLYIKTHKSGTKRYTTWYGEYTTQRYERVLKNWNKIASKGFNDYHYDCSDPPECDEGDGAIAFVDVDEFGTVYLCDAFWDAPLTGPETQVGSLIHETSHFEEIAGTEDHARGDAENKKLAASKPDDAIDNADNYRSFAENHPHLT